MDESLIEKSLLGRCGLAAGKKEVTQKVKVKIMDLGWLFRGKLEFLNLVEVIEAFERDSLFQTIFINSLTQENWNRYLKKIFMVTFLPWLSYTILSVIYFAYSLDDRNKYNDGGRSTEWIIVEYVIILQIAYLLSIEV